MKRFLLIYHDSKEYDTTEFESYEGRIHIEEIAFSKGTTDWEVNELAKSKEIYRQNFYRGRAGEHHFTRSLQRIIEVTRELQIDR